MANTPAPRLRRGRPRNAELRDAVLRAGADLALAGGGAAVSIDAIAKRAAVSRTTIYRWWPSGAAIVLEGLLDRMRPSITPPGGSSAREAVDHQLHALNAILSDATTGPLFRSVIAAAGSGGELATALLDQWLLPRRAAVHTVLLDGVRSGELRHDLDIDVMIDALFSPPYYRLMFDLPALDDAAVTELLDTVWRGSVTKPESLGLQSEP
ncbi:TetR/AcrR family transcriptional regulator [Mycobacterium sp. WMMD1722]|uniref:TetR/AcrR family transcriptional regulator n=1 Tax=Mycobacterium sp. WMMD1722 TaxID=3404117 RepID=UPI003BF6106C